MGGALLVTMDHAAAAFGAADPRANGSSMSLTRRNAPMLLAAPGRVTTGHPAAQPPHRTLTALIGTLTRLIAPAAGLGVFNTVVLGTRDRVHDPGVFKAVGMTPRQTIAMVVPAKSQAPYATGCTGPVKVHLSGGRRQPPAVHNVVSVPANRPGNQARLRRLPLMTEEGAL
jgi:hypothetical protein